jgi:hypothetical protein
MLLRVCNHSRHPISLLVSAMEVIEQQGRI